MKLNYGSVPISGGGAKLMFGTTEVGKLYFGSELVYSGKLTSGTILWEGSKTIKTGFHEDFDLKDLNPDLSNLDANIKADVLSPTLPYTVTYDIKKMGTQAVSPGGYSQLLTLNENILTWKENGAFGITIKKIYVA